MKGNVFIPRILIVAMFLSSCVPAATAPGVPHRPTDTMQPDKVDSSSLTAESYPHVDGSTSTLPLQVMIACTILEVRCAWTEGDFFDSTRRIAPVDNLMASEQNEVIFNLNHSGTHSAYMNLIEKQADLILAAREPSRDELAAAETERLSLDAQPVALDAFVFLVHVDNPVESLSFEQLRDIYTGKITNWSEVGGFDAEIHTYQRNSNSGSQELMEKLVMRGERMLDALDMILMSMMGPFSAIRDDPQGIGYSVYFYAANIFPEEQVKMIAIEGIGPTSATIASRAYPLVTKVYAVLREDAPVGRSARILRDWLHSNEGQHAVEASGYVGLPSG